MKKLVFLAVSTLLATVGCEKKSLLPESPSSELVSGARQATKTRLDDTVKDALIEKLAQAVAQAAKEESFRTLIRDESLKQFDFDYDVLFSFIVDRRINTTQYGEVSVWELLQKGAPGMLKQEDKQIMNDLFKNVQVSMTLNGDQWNPKTFTPRVAAVTLARLKKKTDKVRVYSTDGKKTLLTDSQAKEANEVFLFVRESERVDGDGKLMVDAQGFVLDKPDRKVTAEVAYYQAATREHSSPTLLGTFIEIVNSDSKRKQLDKSAVVMGQQISISGSPANRRQGTNPNARAANNCLTAPTEVIALPSSPFKVRIKWQAVSGAAKYRVYRELRLNGVQEFIAEITPNPSTGTLPTSWEDPLEREYDRRDYYLEAVDANGCSSVKSYGTNVNGSHRNGYYGYEKFRKMYIDGGAWSHLVGQWDNKMELRFKLSKYRKDERVEERTQVSAIDDITGYSQENKWRDYERWLFDWDVTERYAYNYAIFFYEDDGGDDDGRDITQQHVFTIPATAATPTQPAQPGTTVTTTITFKIDDQDEVIGWADVYHHYLKDQDYRMYPAGGGVWVRFGQ